MSESECSIAGNNPGINHATGNEQSSDKGSHSNAGDDTDVSVGDDSPHDADDESK